MASHITRYDLMPIPPIEAHTQWFDAGAVRFGVEYRLLTDAIAAAAEVEAATGTDRADPASFDDRGVSQRHARQRLGVVVRGTRIGHVDVAIGAAGGDVAADVDEDAVDALKQSGPLQGAVDDVGLAERVDVQRRT